MIFSTLSTPVFFSLLAAFFSTVGLIAVATRSDWSLRYSGLFALVASGMLLTIVIIHLIPEAFAHAANAPLYVLGGFFFGLGIHYILRSGLPGPGALRMAQGLTPLIAIAIHSFLDGTIYTVSFSIDFETGVLATFGLILHEIPEAIITFALLRGAGMSNRTSFIGAFPGCRSVHPARNAGRDPVCTGSR